MKSLLGPLSLAITLCTASLTTHADTLADIYELALKNDAQLKAAEATYRANIETEKQAFSALLPQISGSAEYSESDTNNVSNIIFELNDVQVPSATDDDSKSDSPTSSLNLNQTLFDLSTWFSLKAASKPPNKQPIAPAPSTATFKFLLIIKLYSFNR